MGLNIQMQLASSCFLIGLVICFFSRNILKTRAHQIFGIMMITAVVNLVFDIVTVCTLTYIDVVPIFLNTICHIIFYCSLDVFFYFFFNYMLVIIYEARVLERWKQILGTLPLILALTLAITTPITYYRNGSKVYSSSIGVYAMYCEIVLYTTITLYYNLRYWKHVNSRKRVAVLVACLIIFGLGGLQFLIPEALLSATGMVLILFCLFLVIENPGDYVDLETNAMNSHAFRTMLRDQFLQENHFAVVTVLFDDWNEMISRFGPHYGNKLIRRITKYMKQVYTMPMYYPLSGCPTLIADRREAKKIAKQISEKMNMFGELDGVDVDLNWHVCIADYPSHGTTVSDVERNLNFFASHPFNHSKVEEGNIVIYDESMELIANREIAIEKILKDAIQNDGIVMNYQPIYSTVSEEFHSAEALVRLKDTETIGFISPEEFIPIAEKKGLIIDLSMMIFEKVCRFIEEGELEKHGIKYIEVNLSAVHCMDNRLVEQLTGIMNRHGVRPEQLNLEITETTALDVDKSVSSNLNQLIQMGCGFSMDDYGTGYSNLVQIADLTFDIAKIDKSLVWGYFAEDSSKEKVILSSTVDMFKKLEMSIVAEGVETLEQAEKLAEMGVQYLQGYFYSRPIPGEDFITFMREHGSQA